MYDGRPMQRHVVSDDERMRLVRLLLDSEPDLVGVIDHMQRHPSLVAFTVHTSSSAPAHEVSVEWFRYRIEAHSSRSPWIRWRINDDLEGTLRLVTIETSTFVLVCGIDGSEALRAWYLVARGADSPTDA